MLLIELFFLNQTDLDLSNYWHSKLFTMRMKPLKVLNQIMFYNGSYSPLLLRIELLTIFHIIIHIDDIQVVKVRFQAREHVKSYCLNSGIDSFYKGPHTLIQPNDSFMSSPHKPFSSANNLDIIPSNSTKSLIHDRWLFVQLKIRGLNQDQGRIGPRQLRSQGKVQRGIFCSHLNAPLIGENGYSGLYNSNIQTHIAFNSFIIITGSICYKISEFYVVRPVPFIINNNIAIHDDIIDKLYIVLHIL